MWTLGVLTGTMACDSIVETTTRLTQAITAEDSAATDDVADAATDTGAATDRGMDGDCDHPAGERGHPGEAPPEFGALEVAACAPPVAAGVELGRPPHGRGHLATIYDGGDLDDAERAAMRVDLQALVRAGERLPPLPFMGAHHGPGRGGMRPPHDAGGNGGATLPAIPLAIAADPADRCCDSALIHRTLQALRRQRLLRKTLR
jgi:hypothetical protein